MLAFVLIKQIVDYVQIRSVNSQTKIYYKDENYYLYLASS